MPKNRSDFASLADFIAYHKALAEDGDVLSQQVVATHNRVHQDMLFRQSAGRDPVKYNEGA